MAETNTVERPRMQLMCIACRKKEWRALEECATGDVPPASSCCGAATVAMAVEG